MSIKIIVVDDHSVMRYCLCATLRREKDMEVVHDASNGREAVESAFKYVPDVIIMDINMPGLNGVDATRKILADNSTIRIVALSVNTDEDSIKRMFAAGAVGYLPKDSSYKELAAAVRAVISGEPYIAESLNGRILNDYINNVARKKSDLFNLTSREREVLQLMAEGFPTKQMADLMNISTRTAETHRRQIKQKLGIESTAGLVKYAIRHGITSI